MSNLHTVVKQHWLYVHQLIFKIDRFCKHLAHDMKSDKDEG